MNLDREQSLSSTSSSNASTADPNLTNRHSNALKCVHFNVQSIRNKMDQLLIESENFDIVTVSETWLNGNIENDKVQMTGFAGPFRKDRDDGWGGVAIYVKNNIHCKVRPDLNIDGLEAIWCEIQHSKFKYLVASMYRPPNSNRDYWEKFEHSIEQAKSTNRTHK